MADILESIAFLLGSLVYPVLSGPIAAYVYVVMLLRDKQKFVIPFWGLVLITHTAGFLFIAVDDGALFSQGFISCLSVPIFAVSTALGLRIASNRISQSRGEDRDRQRRITIAMFIIPLLQITTAILAAVFAPYLG